MHMIWKNVSKESHLLSPDLGKMSECWISDSVRNQGQNLSGCRGQRELLLIVEPLDSCPYFLV